MVSVWSEIMRAIASLICLINIREGGRLKPQDLTYVCIKPPCHVLSQTRENGEKTRKAGTMCNVMRTLQCDWIVLVITSYARDHHYCKRGAFSTALPHCKDVG